MVRATSSNVSGWDEVGKLVDTMSDIVQKVSAGETVTGVSPGTVEALQAAIDRANAGQVVTITASLRADAVSQPASAPSVVSALGSGYDVLAYYDIGIAVNVDGAQVGSITQTGEPVELAVPLPAGVDGSMVYAARWHDGVLTTLPTTVRDGSVFFSSDQFSLFALVSPHTVPTVDVDAIPDQLYTGQPLLPAVTVRSGDTVLTEGTDYTLSATANVEPGTATLYVTGVNQYVGVYKQVTFRIISPATATPAPTAVPTAAPTSAPTSAPTGDETPLALWAAMLALCAGGLAAAVLAGRKRTGK